MRKLFSVALHSIEQINIMLKKYFCGKALTKHLARKPVHSSSARRNRGKIKHRMKENKCKREMAVALGP